MNERERLLELIPAYLDGKLSPEERQRVETALAQDEALRKEVGEQRRLAGGLKLLNSVRGEHIDSELLALYAEDSADLDGSEIQEIEEHLKGCAECREELELCLKVVGLPLRSSGAARESWFQLLLDKLFPASFAVRPAYVYPVLLFLALGAYMVWDQGEPELTTRARFELNSVEIRGGDEAAVLLLEPAHEIVLLDLFLPTEEGKLYDLTLADDTGAPLLTYHAVLHALPLTIKIPAEALAPGAYRLWAVESPGPGVVAAAPDTTVVRFEVRTPH